MQQTESLFSELRGDTWRLSNTSLVCRVQCASHSRYPAVRFSTLPLRFRICSSRRRTTSVPTGKRTGSALGFRSLLSSSCKARCLSRGLSGRVDLSGRIALAGSPSSCSAHDLALSCTDRAQKLTQRQTHKLCHSSRVASFSSRNFQCHSSTHIGFRYRGNTAHLQAGCGPMAVCRYVACGLTPSA